MRSSAEEQTYCQRTFEFSGIPVCPHFGQICILDKERTGFCGPLFAMVYNQL